MRRLNDGGSLSIEYVIITPILFIVLAMIYVFGRIAEVDGVLDASTRDAARVASEAPNFNAAQQAATQVVRDAIGTASSMCRSTLDVTVSNNFARGSTITVVATCTYPVGDAGLPGAPGTLHVKSQFSSIIDPNRTL